MIPTFTGREREMEIERNGKKLVRKKRDWARGRARTYGSRDIYRVEHRSLFIFCVAGMSRLKNEVSKIV